MNKSLFTKQELQDLRREFVKFKLADMDSEDLFAYIRDVMMNDLIDLDEEELRDEIDDYDEYLYEVLASMSKMKRARMKKCKNLYMIDKQTIGLTTNEQRTI